MRTRGGGRAGSQWRGRGDWRPFRGSNPRLGQWARPPHEAETGTCALSPPTGPLVKSLKVRDLVMDADAKPGESTISDCVFLASFNWLDCETPTIVVPGMPPVWKPLKKPVQLVEDAGEYFRDPNAARYPKFPIEPAVWALLAQNPALSTKDVDLFACGSTLGNLLRFIRDVDKTFRFTVEVVGRTAFFVRRENTPDEKMVGVRGYGHSFPEKYTHWKKGVEGSASHQRLVSYTFGGLKCVVRFEGDGYLEDEVQHSSPEEEHRPLPEPADLVLQEGGTRVPQTAIFDLKTRSVKRKDDDILSEELPRLWITQIPHFVLAFHERGVFELEDIDVRNVTEEVKTWESQNESALGRFSVLIHKIITLAQDCPDGRCEVRCKERGTLEIRRQCDGAARPLPEHLRKRWMDVDWSPSVSDEEDAADGASGSSGSVQHSDSLDDLASFSDDESEKDFTACSDECGYCGHCKY